MASNRANGCTGASAVQKSADPSIVTPAVKHGKAVLLKLKLPNRVLATQMASNCANAFGRGRMNTLLWQPQLTARTRLHIDAMQLQGFRTTCTRKLFQQFLNTVQASHIAALANPATYHRPAQSCVTCCWKCRALITETCSLLSSSKTCIFCSYWTLQQTW